MSFLRTPTEAEATDARTGDDVVARLYERDRAEEGYVANYTKVFALRPGVLAAWDGLTDAIKAQMDEQRYELATLAAAARLRSSYCALAHGEVLADRFLTPAVVRDLVLDRESAAVDRLDVAVMALAERVAGGAAGMTAQDLAPLRDLGLDDGEILSVVLAAAARCFFSTVLDAVGAEPDAAFDRLEPSLRDALTVGRAIERPAVERPAVEAG